MALKKNTTAGEAGESGKFTWEGANENKLLLIILGRHIQMSEYAEVAAAFPGATPGAIRNRIGVLRSKQKKVYEELGWDLPVGGTTPAKKGKAASASTSASTSAAMSTPIKRGLDDDGEGEDEGGEVDTPSKKKPRAVKKKKAKVEVEVESEEEEKEKEEEVGVKEEEGEGEVVEEI